MKKITVYLEDADGKTDHPTGLHIDNGDGTASWAAGAALDTLTPAGSPVPFRGILERLRDDAKAEIPEFVVKPTPPVAPTKENLAAGDVLPAPAKAPK